MNELWIPQPHTLFQWEREKLSLGSHSLSICISVFWKWPQMHLSRSQYTKLRTLNHISVELGLAEVNISVELVVAVGARQVAKSQGKPHRKTAINNREKMMELMKAAFRSRDIGASSSSSFSRTSASLVASLAASLSSLATSVYSVILDQDWGLCAVRLPKESVYKTPSGESWRSRCNLPWYSLYATYLVVHK